MSFSNTFHTSPRLGFASNSGVFRSLTAVYFLHSFFGFRESRAMAGFLYVQSLKETSEPTP